VLTRFAIVAVVDGAISSGPSSPTVITEGVGVDEVDISLTAIGGTEVRVDTVGVVPFEAGVAEPTLVLVLLLGISGSEDEDSIAGSVETLVVAMAGIGTTSVVLGMGIGAAIVDVENVVGGGGGGVLEGCVWTSRVDDVVSCSALVVVAAAGGAGGATATELFTTTGVELL
jgi:hypothetical protein